MSRVRKAKFWSDSGSMCMVLSLGALTALSACTTKATQSGGGGFAKLSDLPKLTDPVGNSSQQMQLARGQIQYHARTGAASNGSSSGTDLFQLDQYFSGEDSTATATNLCAAGPDLARTLQSLRRNQANFSMVFALGDAGKLAMGDNSNFGYSHTVINQGSGSQEGRGKFQVSRTASGSISGVRFFACNLVNGEWQQESFGGADLTYVDGAPTYGRLETAGSSGWRSVAQGGLQDYRWSGTKQIAIYATDRIGGQDAYYAGGIDQTSTFLRFGQRSVTGSLTSPPTLTQALKADLIASNSPFGFNLGSGCAKIDDTSECFNSNQMRIPNFSTYAADAAALYSQINTPGAQFFSLNASEGQVWDCQLPAGSAWTETSVSSTDSALNQTLININDIGSPSYPVACPAYPSG